MSIRVMTAAWLIDLSPTTKLVLLALADNANDGGQCYPSVATLRRKSGLSERAIRAAITRLEVGGHVTRYERPGRSTVYVVHPGTSCTPASNAPLQVVPPPLQEMPPTPARGAPITVIEPSLNHQNQNPGGEAAGTPDPGSPTSVWREGLQIVLAWQKKSQSKHAPIFRDEKAARAWLGSLLASGRWYDRANGHDYAIAPEDREAKLLKLIEGATGKDNPKAYVAACVRSITGLARPPGI